MEPQTDINPFDGVEELMPTDTPDEFYKPDNPYVKYAKTWFARGITTSGLNLNRMCKQCTQHGTWQPSCTHGTQSMKIKLPQ